MRIISLFAFILVSTSPLSETYHHAEAIGIDSASHGLLYGGRVVRRYGDIYNKGLQERADDPPKNAKVQDNKPDNNKAPDNNNNKAPDNNNNKDPDNKAPDNKAPDNKPPDNKPPDNKPPDNKPPDNKAPDNKPPPQDNKPDNKVPAKVPPKLDPKPKKDAPISKVSDDTTDTSSDQDQNTTSDDQNVPTSGTPTVATGNLSTPAVAGLVTVGGVFVLVGGLFAFSQRRKHKEMTKSIVSNSAKAWEQQQNSTYEIMEEETKPLGSYLVIATYTPTLADELDIQPGDKVTILVEYDDGWVQGINETRGGTKGVFPRHCVDMSTSNKTYKNNKRSSSMGGYTGGYTEVDLS